MTEYQVIVSKRKTLGLEVNNDGDIKVRAPIRARKKDIETFVAQHEDWIEKAKAKILARPKPTTKTFETGETYLFLGNTYKLTFSDEITESIFTQAQTLYIPKLLKLTAATDLEIWYKDKFSNLLKKRVPELAQQMKTKFNLIRVSNMKRSWGTCNIKRTLSFNWRLIMAPIEVIDYVIIHELAHTFEMNHSKRFWAIVEAYCPDYKSHMNWLKTKGYQLNL